MNRFSSTAPIVLLLLSLTACSSSNIIYKAEYTPSFRKVAQSIDELVVQPRYENAVWSIVVEELGTGKRLYSRLPDLSLMPASNTKLYTTAAALDQLGPDFRFETLVFANGPISEGTLHGDLIVRGSGDPTISGRFNGGDITRTFRDWADSLQAMGINKIRGDIIGDDNLFDDDLLGFGWSWDDEVYWYSAQLGALSFNDNCVDFTITPTVASEFADVSWEPANTNYITVRNNSRSSEPGSGVSESYWRDRTSNEIFISTVVAEDTTEQESITVHNPTRFFVHVLRQSFEDKGIEVDGYARDIDELETYDYDSARPVIRHQSPNLTEIVAVINKNSQNLYADQVLKALAVQSPEAAYEVASGRAGLNTAAITLERAGLKMNHHNLVDGSGLSRYNMLTAENTVRLLRYMARQTDEATFKAYYDSLPIGGVDGSLARRMTSGPATNNVHAKTGTISNASTLSGYVDTLSGERLIFSIIANNFLIPTSQVRQTQDDVVNLLANLR